jgi:hypothetical protein
VLQDLEFFVCGPYLWLAAYVATQEGVKERFQQQCCARHLCSQVFDVSQSVFVTERPSRPNASPATQSVSRPLTSKRRCRDPSNRMRSILQTASPTKQSMWCCAVATHSRQCSFVWVCFGWHVVCCWSSTSNSTTVAAHLQACWHTPKTAPKA